MSESLTDREAEIMDVLWRRGAATADEIRSLLQGDPHDSTVRTLLRIMEKKGLVGHQVKGRTYIYKANVARVRARRKAVKGLLDRLFGGSVTSLVLQLLDDEKITPEELVQLAEVGKPNPSASKRRAI